MKRKHKFRNSDNSRKELKEAEKKYKKQTSEKHLLKSSTVKSSIHLIKFGEQMK
jgi:hypothetical protein